MTVECREREFVLSGYVLESCWINSLRDEFLTLVTPSADQDLEVVDITQELEQTKNGYRRRARWFYSLPFQPTQIYELPVDQGDFRLMSCLRSLPAESRSIVGSGYQRGVECSQHLVKTRSNLPDQLSSFVELLCLCQRPGVLA